MKLIDKDALVAEIDNILEYADEYWDTDYAIGAKRFANKLQDTIDTLEVKEVGLEKLGEIARHLMQVPEESSIPDIVDKHFWEMLGEEPASKDLEEAAKHFAFHQTYSGDMEYIAENEKEAFKAGAAWQKQQMMKNAHSAEINYWNQCGLSIRLEDVEVEDLAEEGDKVKIIIIKED